MTRAIASRALAQHAVIATLGERAPLQRWQDKPVSSWWVIPVMCACFALGWWIAGGVRP